MVYKVSLSLTLLLIGTLYALLGLYYVTNSPPKGDEFHYTLSVISLNNDKDLALGNNYDQKDYKDFYTGTIDRHTITGKNGKEYMYHGLGLFPFILLPFYILAGRFGVSIALCLASFLFLLNLLKFSRKFVKDKNANLLALILFAISTPIISYSFLVFPEMIAALLFVVCLNQIKNPTTLFPLYVSLLPWVHIRFLPISLGILISYLIFSADRKRIKNITLSLVGVSLYFIFFYYIFGSFDPRSPYKSLGIPTNSGNILKNIVLSLVDGQYGLLVYSPLYILIIPGVIFLWKEKRKLLLPYAIPASLYCLTTFSYYDWNGGYSPPGRYLVPIAFVAVPAFATLFSKKVLPILFGSILAATFSFIAFLLMTSDRENLHFIYMDGQTKLLYKLASFLGHPGASLRYPTFYPNEIFTLSHLIVFFVVVSVGLLLYFLITKYSVNKIKIPTNKNSKE